ncbi:MAG TPA: hypothetical protein V6D28_05455 [Leptolyngbyaceae cyanobacterium]
MNTTKTNLRNEVRELAEEAFQRKLISGYGDGSNRNEFQIVCNGKPKHFLLEEARHLLMALINGQAKNC